MIKVFINDSRCDGKMGNTFKDRLEHIGANKGMELDVTLGSEKRLHEIPRGYDLYIIHFSEVADEEEPGRLRREQPWSEIHYTSGDTEVLEEIRKNADGAHFIISGTHMERFLDQTRQKLGMGVTQK